MTSVYVMKDNGILVSYVTNEFGRSPSQQELESSLLTGIGIGISATFLANINYIVLNDKTVVYYRSFKVGKETCCLIVTNKSSNGVVKDINIASKMVIIKMFLQDKNRWRVFSTHEDGTPIHTEIREKLKSVFLDD